MDPYLACHRNGRIRAWSIKVAAYCQFTSEAMAVSTFNGKKILN